MTLYVFMNDRTQTVSPVEASSPEEARAEAKKLGWDVEGARLFNVDDDTEVQQVIDKVYLLGLKPEGNA